MSEKNAQGSMATIDRLHKIDHLIQLVLFVNEEDIVLNIARHGENGADTKISNAISWNLYSMQDELHKAMKQLEPQGGVA